MAGEGGVRRSGSTDIRSNYSLDTRVDDDDEGHIDVRNATETTGLLGAGAADADGDVTDDVPRKDSWVGAEDFESLPSWRRPSVCFPDR